ncbi:MAG: S1 RNA-binding domain-containing protein [Oscillospiraceae bacterium]|jgi:S1 RNA binding domain protein|nr:S1 RNA-binding domain-containing protein [Oscillospiraceae bacterium]
MSVEIGALLDGKVTGIIEFGAFIDLGDGKTGMVHISEIAQNYVTNIRDHLSIGQDVHVKIMQISPDGKIGLSIKKALPQNENSAAPERSTVPPPPRPQRRSAPNIWQGQRQGGDNPQSFEDMMSQFKKTSEDKISTLRRGGDARYGGGANRRSSGGRK